VSKTLRQILPPNIKHPWGILYLGPIRLHNSRDFFKNILTEFDVSYLQQLFDKKKFDKVEEILSMVASDKYVNPHSYITARIVGGGRYKRGISRVGFMTPMDFNILSTKPKELVELYPLDLTPWCVEKIFPKLISGEIFPKFSLDYFYTYCSICLSMKAGIKIL